MDPLLDFTFTNFPAENDPETSCTHSILDARYKRGVGLCATAIWPAAGKPAEEKPAARINVASCRCFVIAAYSLCLIKMWHACQITLGFLADKLVLVALRQHRQSGPHAGIGLYYIQQANRFLANAGIVVMQQCFHHRIANVYVIANIAFQRIQ